MTQHEKYDFRRKLEHLQSYRGRATELVSLYIPPTKQIHDVIGYLRDEYGQSSNIKSKSTRKNVTGAIESLMSKLKYFKAPPENGLAVFVGHVAVGSNQTKMISELLEPPEQIITFYYRCDSVFFLEPLEGMLEDKKSFGLIVIDRNEATVGMLKGKHIQLVKNVQSRVMGKHRQGGQSAQRFERLIEIAAHEYFKKIGDLSSDTFLAEKEMQGVLVGGPGSTKNRFVEKDYLHHEIKKKIVDTFDTSYTDEYGLRELVDRAADALSDLEIMKGKRLMQRFLAEVKKVDGGLSAYGDREVTHALQVGAVDTLLVSDGLRKYRYMIKCKSCDHEGRLVLQEGQEPECPKCKGDVEISETVDIVDEYYKMADSMGTKVELISQESAEGEMLLKAFGGVAGILRFRAEVGH